MSSFYIYETPKDNLKNLVKTGKDCSTVEDLKAMCSFLYDSPNDAFDDYLKEGLAETILYRLNQLYPESCTTCTKSYAVNRQDAPLLQCYNCDKGCCPPCGEKYVKNLKSCGLNDVFWTCSTCTESRKVFINDEVTKLKKKSKAKPKEKSQDNAQAAEENTANDAETAEENTANDAVEKNTKDTEIEESDLDIEVVETSSSTKPPAKQPPNQKTALCKFYCNNKCRYGISGKGCHYRHEPPCSRIIKHGLGGRYGCHNKCEKFHPKMCRTSLQNRECFRENCTFKHLPNTKRNNDKVQKVNTPKDNSNEGTKIPAKRPTKPTNPIKPSTNEAAKDDSFLEDLKKEVLQQVLQVLGAHGSGHGPNPQKLVSAMNLQQNQPWMVQPMKQPMMQPVMQPMMSHPMMMMMHQ